MSVLRRAMAVVSSALVVAVVLGACAKGGGGDRAPGDSAQVDNVSVLDSAVAPGKGSQALAGAKLQANCTFDAETTRCSSYSSLTFSDVTNGVDAAKFIATIAGDTYWNTPKLDNVRETSDQNLPARFDLRVIKDAGYIQFSDLGAGVVVMARIDVRAPGGGKDKRYKIGRKQNEDWGPTFYLVVDGYDKSATDGDNGGMARSTWRVYGIQKAVGGNPAKLVWVPGSIGKFRFCNLQHAPGQRLDGARFQSCPDADASASVENSPVFAKALQARNESLLTAIERVNAGKISLLKFGDRDMEAALRTILASTASEAEISGAVTPSLVASIKKWFADEPEAPAWMTCGIGCCVADH